MSNPKRDLGLTQKLLLLVMCASFRSSVVAFGGDAAAAAALLPQRRCCSLKTRLRKLMSPVLSTAPCGSSIFDASQAGSYRSWHHQVLRHTLSKDCRRCVLSGLGFYCVASGKWVGVAVKSLLFLACAF